MMFSKFIDNDPTHFNITQILDLFESWCNIQDGTKISKKKREELSKLLHDNPEFVIICNAMYDKGYNSF